jgi:protein TonB
MSPKSLIFSSDQETSRQLGQALYEFGFEVEYCPEIFAAVEKLTSHSYQVIAADWDDGVEASFLLKTARELKANCEAFAIALARPETVPVAKRSGASIVLNKPILPGQTRQTLLGTPAFASRVRIIPQEPQIAQNPYNQLVHAQSSKGNTLSYVKARTASLSPVSQHEVVSLSEPVSPIVPVNGDPFQPSPIQTLFSGGVHRSHHKGGTKFLRRIWRGATFSMFVVAGGMLLYGPVRSGAVTISVKEMYRVARETTQGWLKPAATHGEPILAEIPEDHSLPSLPQGVTRIQLGPTVNGSTPPDVDFSADRSRQLELLPITQSLPVMPQLQPSPTYSYGRGIPQSLRTPLQPVSARDSGSRLSLSLLAALEPVSITEETSEKLLVQKIQPVYPDLAIRTGQQGTVVLQALIGKNGLIQDLKLMGGSLLLGEAAFHAVRQWRYKPYFLNGHAVDAQTLITVDFKLPAVARVSQPQQ